MQKFLKKIFFFSLLICIVSLLLLSFLNPKWVEGRKKTYLENISDKKVDLLIVGSSRAEHTVNPCLFDSAKYNVFNMAEDGHGVPSNYLLLKLMIEKYKLKVGTVLLQVDERSFNGSEGFTAEFRDDFFVTEIADNEVKAAFKKYRGPYFEYTIEKVPFLSCLFYSNFSDLVGLYKLKLSKKGKQKYLAGIDSFKVTKGYEPLKPMTGIVTRNKEFVLEANDKAYFEKLIELCKKNDIKVVCFRAPFLECNKIQGKQFDSYISDFCSSKNIPFIDLKCLYQDPQLYKDQMHTADSAATLITHVLMDSLQMK